MLRDNQLLKLPTGLHADGGGLYLRVSPKGKRTWLVRSRDDGKDTTKTVGKYPVMSLADARRTLTVTLCITSEVALKTYKSKLKVQCPEQIEWLLRPIEKFELSASKKDLVAVLQKKAETAPVLANRMLTRWQDFFNFCVQQGWLENNPLLGVQRKFIGGKEKSRNRVLSWEEIKDLYSKPPIVHYKVLYFILLTGLRPSEALWVLKHRRTKDVPTKMGHNTLPHSHLIQYALKQKFVLPASDLTMSNAMRRKGLTYRPHDLRRTFVTRLNDLGVAPYVVEKMVDHKLQGVMAVYNHAEYWPERNAAQRLWDRKLIALWRSVLAQDSDPCSCPP